MPKRKDLVAEQLDELKHDLEQLWDAIVRDPKKEARKQRMWTVLVGVLSAGGTLAARKLAAKTWSILTGEQPPIARPAPGSAPRNPPTQRTEERKEPSLH
ncbi:MAG: DUF4235 domain-containing protein [Actinomycetota bacterium]|nr:DUF4235 domain-containing protein [Actinomycetota bacterium]